MKVFLPGVHAAARGDASPGVSASAGALASAGGTGTYRGAGTAGIRTFDPDAIRVILFDIDGTLYTDADYSRFQIDVLVEELARVRGWELSRAVAEVEQARCAEALARGQATSSLGNAMARLGVDMATSVAWRTRLIEPERFLGPDPRLAEALGRLVGPPPGLRLVAVTNNPRLVGQKTLAALGVEHLFAGVVGLDDTMKSKPDPAPFVLALELAAVPAGQCLAVGDRYDVDLAVPLAIGMGAVLVDGVADVYALPDLILGLTDS